MCVCLCVFCTNCPCLWNLPEHIYTHTHLVRIRILQVLYLSPGKRRYLILRAGCLYYFSNETASSPKGKFVLSGYVWVTQSVGILVWLGEGGTLFSMYIDILLATITENPGRFPLFRIVIKDINRLLINYSWARSSDCEQLEWAGLKRSSHFMARIDTYTG